ncbi:hypothetical protein TNCV_172671 [Trichonephila clavipes]|nr:hypothetical protein TNCV_172671 [Trichonephila clavipes]
MRSIPGATEDPPCRGKRCTFNLLSKRPPLAWCDGLERGCQLWCTRRNLTMDWNYEVRPSQLRDLFFYANNITPIVSKRALPNITPTAIAERQQHLHPTWKLNLEWNS